MDHWPIPKNRGFAWRTSSMIVKLCTSVFLRFMLRTGHRVQMKNMETLAKAVIDRPIGMPLVTVSNHTSCVDDPVIWSGLPLRFTTKERMSRWLPGAREFCFTNKLISWFFSRGQIVPVVRGDGVYQHAMNFCVNLLNEGNWIHVFPEGKINLNGYQMRMKWGVGRMVAESIITPLILPVWHVGMDDIIPNSPPYQYVPRFFKKLTIYVGDPIDVSSIVKAHYQQYQTDLCANAVELRKQITDLIQDRMYDLKSRAETLHSEWSTHCPVAFRRI